MYKGIASVMLKQFTAQFYTDTFQDLTPESTTRIIPKKIPVNIEILSSYLFILTEKARRKNSRSICT